MAKLRGLADGDGRPRPPAEWLKRACQSGVLQVRPAPELLSWARSAIVAEGGAIHNSDHVHLADADLAFAWASTGFQKAGRTVLGQAEQVMFRAGGWQKARQEQQMIEWFGRVAGLPHHFGRRLLCHLQRRGFLRVGRA